MIPNDRQVSVVEVGPRDGLQNEARPPDTRAKVAFIDALSEAGFSTIEATSFVSPKAVPNLADASEVMTAITRRPGVRFLALAPNKTGLDRAIAAGVDGIVLFTAATDAFANANIRTSIDGSFARFGDLVNPAREAGLWIRGAVSVAFGCPYTETLPSHAAARVAMRLLALGCDEISLADTIGVATPESTREVVEQVLNVIPVDQLSLHFHDTAGRAVENVAAGLELGVRVFDSSAGGLGGCPFAPGAPGNLATETLLAYLAQHGWQTGVDLARVQLASAGLREAISSGAADHQNLARRFEV